MKVLQNIIIGLFMMFVASSCSEDDYGKHSDIDLPVPTIASITSDPLVGEEITIAGQDFAIPNTVSIDGISMKVVSESENEIRAILPRLFEVAPVVVRNVYGRLTTNENTIKPKYPPMEDIVVNKWPTKIIRERAIFIKGDNVDLVKEIRIGETVISVNGLTQSPGRIAVLIPNTLQGTASTIKLKTVYGSYIESPELPIEDPSDWFEPVDPVVLLDFEDGETHFAKGDIADADFTAQINREGISAPEGSNFFSFYVDNISSNWLYLGSIKLIFSPAIDLIEFTDPHISFRFNSADNVGNFQFKVVQDGKVGGSYFANGVTNDPLDRWMLRPTSGEWQWVTARLRDLINENWGGDFTKFDPQGRVEEVELIFKQINAGYWDGVTSDGGAFVNNKFKLNIDQVMITDGPVGE